MRCYCCPKILTTQEATRRFAGSGMFTEMCNECLSTIDVETEEGKGFSEDESLFDEDGYPIDEDN